MSLSVYLGCGGGGGSDTPQSDGTAADASASSPDAGDGPTLDAASPCPTPQQVDMLDDVGNTWTAFLDLGADGACALVADAEFTLDTVVFYADELDAPAARYFIYPVQPWYLSINDTACTFNGGPPERLECPVGFSEGPKHIRLEHLEDLRAVDVTAAMERDTHRLTLLELIPE